MATNIIQTFNFLSVQTGNGAPNHISNKPTLYFDKDSDLIYLTSDGAGNWVHLLDSSTPITGGTSGGTNTFVTGFTYSNNNLSLYRNDNVILTVNASIFTGLTINGVLSASTYQNLPTDIRVTGGTYSAGTAMFTNNTGGTFSITGFSTGSTSTDIYVTGFTYSSNIFSIKQQNQSDLNVIVNQFSALTATSISATTYLGLPLDIRITGGTYTAGTAVFTNNTGGTFNVSGFSTGSTDTDTYITGGTPNNSSKIYIFTNNTGGTFNVVGLTDITITGFSYDNANKFTLINNTGGTLSVFANTMTGLTINGSLSATTYLNLPTDIRVTGGTYSAGTSTFINNTGGTFNISGFYTGSTDVFVTGGTFNGLNRVASFTNNTGGTFSVSGFNDTYITGSTTNNSSKTYLLNNNTGGTITIIGLTDIFVTGGTYSAGTAVFTNNTGGTFNVSGFSTGSTDIFVTGGTPNNTSKIYTFTNNTGGTFNVSALTDISITGGTYSNGTAAFTNNTGGTFNISGFYNGGLFTGGTVTGATNFNGGLTANTISATTYQNLPNSILTKSWDGQGGFISSGNTRYLISQSSFTIRNWSIVATGVNPAVTFDIWKISSGTTLPTVANTIMGTKPALSTGNAIRSSITTGWSTLSIAAGDILAYNIDSSTSATTITFNLEVN